MIITKEYAPCIICKGNGLQTNGKVYGEEGYRSWECFNCKGHGKVLVNKTVERREKNEQLPR